MNTIGAGKQERRLAAVLVTYDRPVLLAEHLDILARSSIRPSPVIVVDNANDPAAAPESHPHLDLVVVRSTVNSGPAGGFKQGIEAASSFKEWEWLLLLDDDDPPRTSDALAQLLDLATVQGTEVGGVGLAGAVLKRRLGLLQSTLHLSGDYVACDYLSGGYLPLYRRAAVLPAPFEEEMFFGFEELGAGLNIKRRGFELVASNHHARDFGYSQDTNASRVVSIDREYYSTRNFVYLARRDFRSALPLIATRHLLGIIAARRFPRSTLAKVRFRAWRDAIFGNLGPIKPLR